MSDDENPIDVTAVNYGIAGESNCLPVWVLGPSGIPVPGFSSTIFLQLVCQSAQIPPDLVTDEYVPPAGLPPPDFCISLPPQHTLTKYTHFLVIVMLLPIKFRKYHLHCQLMNQFDAMAAHHWQEIVETATEVIHHASEISEEVSIILYFNQHIAK